MFRQGCHFQIIDTGAISAVQLEAVVYACQAHEMRLPSNERVGYLIGWLDIYFSIYMIILFSNFFDGEVVMLKFFWDNLR